MDEIAVRILDTLLDKRSGTRLRDDMADLGNALSPHELGELYQFLASMISKSGLPQIASVAPMWAQLLNNPGAVFHREQLFEGARLFRSEVEGPERSCLVCFTGMKNQMFMSTCRFLENLSSYPVDVVVLSTTDRTFTSWDMGGAGSFPASLALLKRTLAERGITIGVYLGTSAGANAAVYAAVLDGQASCVLFGGRPWQPGRKVSLAEAGTAFSPLCDCWGGPKPYIYSIFNAEEQHDAECDAKLRALSPTVLSYPIPKESSHNSMATLAARRKLRPVLEQVVQLGMGKPANFDLVTQQ